MFLVASSSILEYANLFDLCQGIYDNNALWHFWNVSGRYLYLKVWMNVSHAVFSVFIDLVCVKGQEIACFMYTTMPHHTLPDCVFRTNKSIFECDHQKERLYGLFICLIRTLRTSHKTCNLFVSNIRLNFYSSCVLKQGNSFVTPNFTKLFIGPPIMTVGR